MTEPPETPPAARASRVKGDRLHKGDIMSPEKRSAVMARIRGRDTGPERVVEAMLVGLGIQYESHARDLPGRPDFVIRDARVAILVDGDFWHGWQFDSWRLKLSEKWERKIAANRRRDTLNRRLLRNDGWTVVRIWEHQVRKSPARCRQRIRRAIAGLPAGRPPGSLAVHEPGTMVPK
jgi:DNA mismatch endonuclease (patch repair protein)